MLHLALVRSTIPHGRILRIDDNQAEKMPGVVLVIKGQDVPKGLHGRGLLDTPIITTQHVRYIGDPVAAVIAESRETAIDAAEAVEIEYDSLPAVFDPEESMTERPSAIIHPDKPHYERSSSKLYKTNIPAQRPNVSAYQRIQHGDVENAFKRTSLIIEGVYTTAPLSHVQLEPTSVIAKAETDGSLTVITSGQTPFRTRKELSDSLGIPESNIRVISPKHVGGGFGNRGAAVYEPICAAAAMKTEGRPVKLVLSRWEELGTTTSRHSTKVWIRDALTKDGRIMARKLRVIYDGGAYSVAGNVAVRNALYAISSVYNIPNLSAEIFRVYTNKIQGGAFRGFGSTQVYWAIESQMDEIARHLNVDPLKLRSRNILRNGDRSCIGEVMNEDTMDFCLQRFSDWLRTKPKPVVRKEGSWVLGRGIAIAKHQCDTTFPNIALVRVSGDSTIDLLVGSTDVGQGTFTGLAQIVAEEFKIPIEKVRITPSDTFITPVAVGSSGSRQLVQMGQAVMAACQDAKKKILELASKALAVPEKRLSLENGNVYAKGSSGPSVRLNDLFSPGPMGGEFVKGEGLILGKGLFYSEIAEIDPATGQSSLEQVALDYTPICACVDVAVDRETGFIQVLNMWLALDIGKAINPALIEGQIQGGAWMGLSTTILEGLIMDNGQILNQTLMDYLVGTSIESSPIESLVLESGQGPGPMGARSLGELPILPIAPAIANAVRDATGARLKDLPLTPETVLKALKAK
jgi:CO/xanthine dehydrogenase Mo-binding subunit